jgi:parallel beta-helix repeat protein
MLGPLLFAIKIQPAEATGTVYIRADGSIDPPTAPISTVDNVTYVLTDNITGGADGIVVERDNIVVDGAGYALQGSGSGKGIDLTSRSNAAIDKVEIRGFQDGINLYESYNNTISGNEIANNGEGIWLSYSSDNSISGNNITNDYRGIWLASSSSNNSISENSIEANNLYGVFLDSSSGNVIYHNDFVDNTQQVYIETLGYANVWDDGYPSGGNYWSDYNSTDSNGDGIGDTPYVIDANNQDNYPLVSPYEYWANPILGDVNRDMQVNMSDIDFCRNAFGSIPGGIRWIQNCDLNTDGKVDMRDIGIACVNFGKHYH